MILFAGNARSGDTVWQNAWRNMSCRYLVSLVNPPSTITAPDWTAIDALDAIQGVVFAINRGQGSASSGSSLPRSAALVSGVAESVGVAVNNNAESSRKFGAINVNVEPGGLVAFMGRVGPGVTAQMPSNGFDWTSSSSAERRSLKAEVNAMFPELVFNPDANSGQGSLSPEPTWDQAHQAFVGWLTSPFDAIRTHSGTPTNLIVSQWWKTPSSIPFFGAGWWGSGAYPGTQCSGNLNFPNCFAASGVHDTLGNRIYTLSGTTFTQSTSGPSPQQWIDQGWAAAAEALGEQFYANSVGVLGSADLMPLQQYSMPFTEAETAAHLDVTTTNGFVRGPFQNQYQPVQVAIDSRKENFRRTWRAASARYGEKAAIGTRWMVDSNSGGWLGAWAPPDLFREVLDYAFEPGEGTVAPKHIGMWSSASFLDDLFGTSTTEKDQGRRIVLARFAGRTSVPPDWDLGTSQSPNEPGRQWRAAIAALFDEDTYERVLVAKGCIARARTRHAARASTLDAGGIVIQPVQGEVSATGGTESTITVDGVDYRVHTFTSSGTLTVTEGGEVEYLVVGGGGGGGGIPNASGGSAGGGGGGGYRCSVAGESSGGGASAESPLTVTAQQYTVTVGSGGAGGVGAQLGSSGGSSSFGSITALGGGGGSAQTIDNDGAAGGSGGGARQAGTGGAGTSGQGFAGGDSSGSDGVSSGGGGAGAAGTSGSGDTGGDGGIGVASSITGQSVYRAGGGGGSGGNTSPIFGGAGGLGGGGTAPSSVRTNGVNGTANTGGGGSGASGGTGTAAANGGSGGSGIVIVRYEISQ